MSKGPTTTVACWTAADTFSLSGGFTREAEALAFLFDASAASAPGVVATVAEELERDEQDVKQNNATDKEANDSNARIFALDAFRRTVRLTSNRGR